MHAPSYKSFGSAPLALLFHQPGMSASTLHVLPRPPMAWTSRCCILNLKSPTDAFPVSTPAPTNNPNIAPAPLDVPSNRSSGLLRHAYRIFPSGFQCMLMT